MVYRTATASHSKNEGTPRQRSTSATNGQLRRKAQLAITGDIYTIPATRYTTGGLLSFSVHSVTELDARNSYI